MKISIVVPAFNEERLLGASLAQIKSAAAAFTRIGWETELIVCDNNSTDRTAEIARAAGATVVFEAINQIARARNAGAAAATGDWLVFVDADSHPGAELFADVAEQIQSGKCLAGGATVRLDEKHFVAGCVTRLWNCASRCLKLLAGSFIFVETATFRKVGGFSNELFVAEELELSRRLKKLARGPSPRRSVRASDFLHCFDLLAHRHFWRSFGHAGGQGRGIVILHRHPLVTSARKMRLYTMREHLRFLTRVIFSNGRALGSREKAHLWYDGRR